MKRILIPMILLVSLLFQSLAVYAGPWDYIMEEYLYDNGLEEANGEIYYIAGTNDINRKIKFSMDMGLIEKYTPGATATRNELKKVLNLLFGGDFIYEKYYKSGTEEEPLTVDEAIIALLDSAGYGPYIEMSGNGKSSAYYVEASKRGVLQDVNYTEAKRKFTLEHFYNMFYNVLTIPTFEGMYSTNGTGYRFSDENTLLTTDLDLTLISGVVMANSYTSVNGGPEAGADSLRIGNKTYRYDGLKDADSFLGYKVEAYIDSEGKLCSIAVDERTNTMKYFNDSVTIQTSNDKNLFKYYDEKDRLKTLTLDQYADVVYNHVAHPGFTSADFQIENGYMQFIDHDDDNLYDVVFIYEYTSFMPKAKYVSDHSIVDKLGNKYDLSEIVDSNTYSGMFNENGETIEFEDITMRNGISLLLAPNSNIATELILLDETTYEGKYSTFWGNSDTPYTIGENEYEVAPIYYAESGNKFPHNLGDRILIYLDHRGKIINSVMVDDTLKYAYVRNMAGKTVFDTQVKMQLFTEDSQMMVYEVAEKLSYMGRKIKESDLMNGNAFELYDRNGLIQQLIRYKLNAEGEIIQIDIAAVNTEPGAYNEGDDFEINYDYKTQGTLYYIDGAVKSFGAKYRLNKATTKVFNIPEDDREEEYNVSSIYDINGENRYSVKIYDVDEYYNPGAIIIMRQKLENRKYTWIGASTGFVLQTGKELDKVSETALDYVNYRIDWWEQTAYAHPDWIYLDEKPGENNGGRYNSVKVWTDLRPGDVIEFVTDASGRVVTFAKNLTLDYTMPLEEQTFEAVRGIGLGNTTAVLDENTFYGENVLAFGKVIRKNSDGMVFNAHRENDFGDKKWNRTLTISETQDVNCYNIDRNICSLLSFADIQDGDFVFLKMNKGVIKAMAVYRQ